MRRLSMDELGRKTVQEFRAADKTPMVIVLNNVRSMQNVGSVFRTADAFLLAGICLCGYTPVPPHRDIHKTALGATETVEWRYFSDAATAVEQLKQEGYLVLAVEQATGSVALDDFMLPAEQPVALIFGNEVSGVEEPLLRMADGCIEIPQVGMKHSLNIAVSAGIVIWDLFCKLENRDKGHSFIVQ